jgi:hemoglobin
MASPRSPIPTPAEHAGGLPAFERLTDRFYDKVRNDPVLAPVFAEMSADHPRQVAAFMVQCFGGGPTYSRDGSENQALREMIGKHLGRHLTEAQRRRWATLLMDSADEVGLPDDPEFRSAFAAKIEWGTRIAVMNSGLDENPIGPNDHIPRFGWGSVDGPFEAVGSICTFPVKDEKIIP